MVLQEGEQATLAGLLRISEALVKYFNDGVQWQVQAGAAARAALRRGRPERRIRRDSPSALRRARRRFACQHADGDDDPVLMSDGPLIEIAEECERLIEDGATIFQRSPASTAAHARRCPTRTCSTSPAAATSAASITDMRVHGCGFMLVAGDPEMVEIVQQSIENAPR